MPLSTNESVPRSLPECCSALADEEIVRRVLEGEVGLFELILRRYNQRIYRVVRSILPDDNEAEDVLQDAYLRCFERLRQFQGRAKFSTWLTRIAIYEAAARRRRRQRMHVFDPYTSENLIAQSLIATDDAAQEISRQELRAVLANAVQTLPEELRVVFTLRIVEELSTQETADCLALTPSNVKVRLHRARALLQECIDNQLGQEVRQLYQFGNERCDRVVTAVMSRLARRDR